jgi:uncharacterized membrane protein YgcG
VIDGVTSPIIGDQVHISVTGGRASRATGLLLVAVVVALFSFAQPALATCSQQTSLPNSGTLTLKYLRVDAKHSNRNDYRLSGTVRWDKQADLDCFSKGHVDWAYENDLKYQQHFDRAIWNVDFSSLPRSSNPYIDTTADDFGNSTDLTFGIFRPESLAAIILPNNPSAGYHSFRLQGQILNRNCPRPGPWCVGLDSSRGKSQLYIGEQRKFSITGTTCWKWTSGKSPVSCTASGGGAAGGSSQGSSTSGAGDTGGGDTDGGSSGGTPPGGPAAVTLAQGAPAAPAGFRYAISLTGFAPNTAVSIACFDSVSPSGFYTFSLVADGAGNASTASYCYSGDGPDHWVIANGVESNHVPWGGSSAPPTQATPTYAETVGGVAHTWTNYTNAGGSEGPSIPAYTTVEIACKLQGFRVADGNTWWYRIASNPWNSGFYVSADAFYNNGQTSGGLHGTPFVDPGVRDC